MKTFSNLKATTAPAVLGLAMVSAVSTPAFAQDAAAEADDNTIVVTGSRIARPEVESVSPVTTLSSEEIANTGTTRVEDLTNSLPQVFAGQNAFIANGATGTATVNLRGLGTTRTLVLVNGRRLQPGDPSLPVADLNQIPASLVKSVEVSTGGASAVYGADAVAGVVNFIMDTEFEGFQVDGNISFYQHRNRNNSVVDSTAATPATLRDRINARGFGIPGKNQVDGFTFDTTATFGAAFDDGRGHVTGYVGYRQTDPIFQADRDHSACALSRSAASDRITCGGSFNSINAVIVNPDFGAFNNSLFGVGDGTDTFDFTGNPTGNPPYNYAPINYFQRPNKRWTAGFFADYEISDAVKPYAEFMFMDSRTVAQIAESGTFFNDTYQVRCGDDPATAAVETFSPLLNANQAAFLCSFEGVQAVNSGGPVTDPFGNPVLLDPTVDGLAPLLIGKRNVEGGPRQSDLRHTAYRAVFGVKGNISDNWSYDVSGQYGTTIYAQTYFNDLSLSRLRRALDAETDAGGNIVCAVNNDASTANDDAACAPYNPFQGPGLVANPANGITQAAINYVNTPGFQRGETEEFIVSGFVTGALGEIPMASDPVSVVLGAEYRKEQLRRDVDVAFQTGDLAGQGGPTTNLLGEFSVRELFSELLVPIVQDTPGVYNLSLELGYRFSDYTTAGTTHTYKIAGEYSPVEWVKLRGGYNRAVRAPNIVELFSPNRIALFGGTDNCAGPLLDGNGNLDPVNGTPGGSGFTAAQCANTGATNYGGIAASPAGQYNQFIGAGPGGLAPEKANTYTAGFVLNGGGLGLDGFNLTVDYFNIEVNNLVSTLGAQTILDSCARSGDPFFCNLVTRDPISQNLWAGQNGFVTNLTRNIGGLKTSGVDINMAYSRPVGPGLLSANFVGTWLNELVVDNGFIPVGLAGGDGVYDCQGFHGAVCGTPNPEWRHQFRLGWQADDGYGLSVRWRHFGSVRLDEFSSDPDLSTDPNPDARGNIGAQNYFDLTLNFDIGENLGINLGVNNIFDRDPPLIATQYGSTNGNTYANVYDPVGRYVFLNGTIKF